MERLRPSLWVTAAPGQSFPDRAGSGKAFSPKPGNNATSKERDETRGADLLSAWS